MTTEPEELKQNLGIWAGFRFVSYSKWSDAVALEEGKAYWVYPDNSTHKSLPNFPHSLDACFEWLIPKLNEQGLRLHQLSRPAGRAQMKPYFCCIGGKWLPYYTADEETPALALCRAIEKRVDEEKVVS